MAGFFDYIPFHKDMTYADVQLIEKNLEREAYRGKFMLKKIPSDTVKHLLSSDTHFHICHSLCVEENKRLSFPRTRIPYFYTLEDIIEYIKPAPKESVLNSILNTLIPTDNFLKEEVVFLKYMSYLKKYIMSYHDILIRRNSPIKFQPLQAITANMERKYSKRYMDGSPSVVEIELRTMLGSEEIKNVTIDPLLKGIEVFGKKETSVRDGYFALLWIRSVILRAGKVHIHPRDLSFCKTIQLLYALWDMYREDSLVKELQELHHDLRDSNLHNQDNQTMIEGTCSNNPATNNITNTSVVVDNSIKNKNNSIRNLKKIEKIMEHFAETTIMHFELMKKLPLSYKPFYGGRDTHDFLLLSFIWDVCSNLLKMKDFEDVPPLKAEILKTILESDIWQMEMFIEKLEDYRRKGCRGIRRKFTVMEKDILPSLCEAIYRFTHSPKIFYDFLNHREIVFYELEINKTEESKKKE